MEHYHGKLLVVEVNRIRIREQRREKIAAYLDYARELDEFKAVV